MNSIITEAQYIIDHPDEHVSGADWRRVMDGLLNDNDRLTKLKDWYIEYYDNQPISKQ